MFEVVSGAVVLQGVERVAPSEDEIEHRFAVGEERHVLGDRDRQLFGGLRRRRPRQLVVNGIDNRLIGRGQIRLLSAALAADPPEKGLALRSLRLRNLGIWDRFRRSDRRVRRTEGLVEPVERLRLIGPFEPVRLNRSRGLGRLNEGRGLGGLGGLGNLGRLGGLGYLGSYDRLGRHGHLGDLRQLSSLRRLGDLADYFVAHRGRQGFDRLFGGCEVSLVRDSRESIGDSPPPRHPAE